MHPLTATLLPGSVEKRHCQTPKSQIPSIPRPWPTLEVPIWVPIGLEPIFFVQPPLDCPSDTHSTQIAKKGPLRCRHCCRGLNPSQASLQKPSICTDIKYSGTPCPGTSGGLSSLNAPPRSQMQEERGTRRITKLICHAGCQSCQPACTRVRLCVREVPVVLCFQSKVPRSSFLRNPLCKLLSMVPGVCLQNRPTPSCASSGGHLECEVPSK